MSKRILALTLFTLAVLAAGTLIPVPARAQSQHDLELVGLKLPAILERGCPIPPLQATFQANGALDPQKVREVEVVFRWSPRGAVTWTEAGIVRETFDPATRPLSRTASVQLSWTPPNTLPDNIDIQVEVRYGQNSGLRDEVPGNNAGTDTIQSKAGSCGNPNPSPTPPKCSPLPGGKAMVCMAKIPVVKRWMLEYLDKLPNMLREIGRCRQRNPENPHRCVKWPEFFPPVCQTAPCPLCMRGLTCPVGQQIAIRFATPVRDLEIRLMAGPYQEITRAELVGIEEYEPAGELPGLTVRTTETGEVGTTTLDVIHESHEIAHLGEIALTTVGSLANEIRDLDVGHEILGFGSPTSGELEPGQEVAIYRLEFEYEPGIDYRLSITPGVETPMLEVLGLETRIGSPEDFAWP